MKLEGLVLESKYPQLQYIVKGPIEDDWRDGIPVRRPKHIVLEFDRHILFMDELIRDKELTEEDQLHISKQLDYEFSKPNFVDFWEHKAPVPSPPWPTYDETHHSQVANVAQATGLVAEALRYEQARPQGARSSVVEKLQSLLGDTESMPFTPEDDALAAV